MVLISTWMVLKHVYDQTYVLTLSETQHIMTRLDCSHCLRKKTLYMARPKGNHHRSADVTDI